MTPSLRLAVEAYEAGDLEYYYDFPRSHTSLGGRFNNHLLCQLQHRLLFDASLMEEILAPAGFVEVREYEPGETGFIPPEVFELLPWEQAEGRGRHRSLFVEARKPGAVSSSSRG